MDHPALLLHGFVSSAIGWWMNGAAQRLAETHRVLAPDFRGHGESGKPSDPAAYGPRLVSDLGALLDAEGLAAADVVGFSMGAEVGLAMAAWHPDRVRSLTLTGSGWSPPEIMTEYRKWFGILVTPENGRPPHPNAAALAAVIEGMPSLVGLPGDAVAALPMPVRGIIGENDDERPPSMTSPARSISASGSCNARWITRFSGRAPKTGS
jgi:pimeloyl-ACP methyl ester carboxylesterase